MMQFSFLAGCPGQEWTLQGTQIFYILLTYLFGQREERRGWRRLGVSDCCSKPYLWRQGLSWNPDLISWVLGDQRSACVCFFSISVTVTCGHAWLLHLCQRSELWVLLTHGTRLSSLQVFYLFLIFILFHPCSVSACCPSRRLRF